MPLPKYCGMEGNEMVFCVELDKLDKIGSDRVKENLIANGADESGVVEFLDFIQSPGDNRSRLSILKNAFNIENEELNDFFDLLSSKTEELKVEFDLSLARGLTYYTGMIFEVKPTHCYKWEASVEGGDMMTLRVFSACQMFLAWGFHSGLTEFMTLWRSLNYSQRNLPKL